MSIMKFLKIIDVLFFWIGSLGLMFYLYHIGTYDPTHWFLGFISIAASLKTTIQFLRIKKKHKEHD